MPVLFKKPTPSQINLIKNAIYVIFHYLTNKKIPQVPRSGDNMTRHYIKRPLCEANVAIRLANEWAYWACSFTNVKQLTFSHRQRKVDKLRQSLIALRSCDCVVKAEKDVFILKSNAEKMFNFSFFLSMYSMFFKGKLNNKQYKYTINDYWLLWA